MMEPIGLEPLFPDRDSPEPLGRQFVRRLRHAIENGLFKPSSRLLPSRELALRLGLSRNTVTSAIETTHRRRLFGIAGWIGNVRRGDDRKAPGAPNRSFRARPRKRGAVSGRAPFST
jgi:DNA-binding transcriptional MocR family regulator